MAILDWQLSKPISAVIFDCDGTLATIEGIDYLAECNNVGETVKALTADAMGKTGINSFLYQQRLDLVQPTQEQVKKLGQTYFDHRVPDAENTINILQRLHKSVYLISAGLNPAVSIFGERLKIPHENIFAVNAEFDDQGNYLSFDQHSPLVNNDGKRQIVKQLLQQHKEIMYVGDGLNDVVVKDLVTRFVGYGGIFYRENIAERCNYYINTSSLSSLLALGLTQQEYENCSHEEKKLYQKGMHAINDGGVIIKLT